MPVNINGSTGISGVDGSAGTPAIQGSDTNTGVFFGTNTIDFSTDGTSRLSIDSSGRVGIGTTSPGLKFEVHSGTDNAAAEFVSTDARVNIGFADSGSTLYSGLSGVRVGADGDNLAIYTANSESARIDSSGRVGIGTASPASKLHVYENSASPARIYLENTEGRYEIKADANLALHYSTQFVFNNAAGTQEYARIDSSGRLGIGTSSPDQALSVGSGAADTRMSINGTGQYQLKFTNSGAAGFWIGSPGANSLAFAQDDGTTRMTIDSSGRLLVGTSTSVSVLGENKVQLFGENLGSSLSLTRTGATTQSANLVFGRTRGDASTRVSLNNDDVVGRIYFVGDDGTDIQTPAALIQVNIDGTPGANDMPGRLVFSTTADGAASPTERARITSGGYFKASNSGSYSQYSLATALHHFESNTGAELTAAFINSTATSPYGVIIRYTGSAPNNTGNEFLIGADSTTNRFVFRSNGGLANYSANNVNLSDINTKKDISPVADTWNCLKEWEIVNFRYKDQPDDADLNLGVIAQQVAESCPEVITVFQEATEDQPEKLGVKEQQMYWMAIKALQEAQVRIETLEAKVAALEGA